MVDEAKYQLLKQRYANGEVLHTLCKELGFPKSTIVNRLKKEGLYNKRPDLTSEEQQKIIDLRNQGWSFTRIGIELGYTERKITNFYKKIGLYTNKEEEKTKTVRQIDRGNNQRVKYSLNEDFFNKIDCEKKAYWLGFIFADGHLSNNRLSLKLKGDEKNILDILISDLEFTGSYREENKDTNFKDNSHSIILEINSTKLAKSLSQYMPVGKKSDKIRLPILDKELYKHFIRGYFDGDGYSMKYRGKIGFVGNNEFLIDLKNYFIQNKFSTEKDGWHRKYNDTYGELQFGKKVSKKIMDWFYTNSSIFLKRKNDDFYIS